MLRRAARNPRKSWRCAYGTGNLSPPQIKEKGNDSFHPTKALSDKSLHTHRAARRYRHYRDSGGYSLSRFCPGARGSSQNQLSLEHEAVDARLVDVLAGL